MADTIKVRINGVEFEANAFKIDLNVGKGERILTIESSDVSLSTFVNKVKSLRETYEAIKRWSLELASTKELDYLGVMLGADKRLEGETDEEYRAKVREVLYK